MRTNEREGDFKRDERDTKLKQVNLIKLFLEGEKENERERERGEG